MIPRTSPLLIRTFARYSRWYIKRNFHSVRINGALPSLPDSPAVIYLNHASWWDPLIGLLLAQKFWANRQHFAPIDAAALKQYRFFSRLGFFGVEANTHRGAADFLRNSADILQSKSSTLWITGEGTFRDPRTRPTILQPGLAHLARRTTDTLFIPLAIEYPFGEERFPEVLLRFGTPSPSSPTRSVPDWNRELQTQMQLNQDALAADAIARKPHAFRTILRGRSGVGAIYDAWRWTIAKLKGQPFQRQHGDAS